MPELKRMKIVAYMIKCPNCSKVQEYSPQGKTLPEDPKKYCIKCKKMFRVTVPWSKALTPTVYDRINTDLIHDLLVRAANGDNINLSLVRMCIEFCKGFKDKIVEEKLDIDLGVFTQIGKSIESNRVVSRAVEE